jgi:hypothetical protein
MRFSLANSLGLALAVFAVVGCGSSSPAAGSAPDAGGDDGGTDASTLSPNGDPPGCTSGAMGGTSPPARSDHAGALDPAGANFVVFGGDTVAPACPNPTGAHSFQKDTWVLDVGCHAWTQAQPSVSPKERARHMMVTDPAGGSGGGRAILFGGRTRAGATGNYTLFNDAWGFDFASQQWTQVATTGTAPAPRSNTAGVLDVQGNQLVVFGGNTDATGFAFSPVDDTWALDLSTGAWRALATKGKKPPARLFHAMAIDNAARVAYVYSGGDANAFMGPFLHDVWALDLASETWSQVQTSGDPTVGFIKHSLVFDATSKRLFTFGGHDDGVVGNENTIWVLDLGASPAKWSQLPHGDAQGKPATGQCTFPPDFTKIDLQSPERRSGFAYGARADGRGFVIFAGEGDCGFVDDAWWWADGSEGWTPIVQVPAGLSCLRVKTMCSGLCG